MRTCTKCATLKDDPDFAKYTKRDGSSAFRGVCRVCLTRKTALWREQNPERYAQSNIDRYAQNRDAQLTASKVYYHENREKQKLKHREWHATNCIQINAARRNMSEEDRVEKREADKRSYRKHKETRMAYIREWKKRNPEKVKAANKISDQRNPLTKRLAKWRRRVREHQNGGPPVTPATVKKVLAKWGSVCWVCQAPYTEIGHYKPIVLGGTNHASNLRPTCVPCNRSKGGQDPVKWFKKRQTMLTAC